MKIKKLGGAVAATAITVGIAAGTVAPASAANNIKPFGQQETLNDYATGAPMIGYTVNGLSPSSDAVPHNGDLYAASVTVEGLGGWATPLVPLFNARAESGQNYRVIADAPGGPAQRPQVARQPASSTSMSWATCRTASSTTTELRIFWFGCPAPPREVCLVVVAHQTSLESPPRSSATHPLAALSLEETWRPPPSCRPRRRSTPSRLPNNMKRMRAGKPTR